MNEPQFEPPPGDARRELARFEDERREQGKVGVGLDFRTTWCPHHLEPYRATWPRGAPAAMIELFKAFTEDERAQEMTGGDATKLAAVVAECSPLCCFIDPARLDEVYATTGVTR